MRSNFILGLAAIALGFGIAGASAATIDLSLQAKSTAKSSSLLPPQGSFASGFSAIRMHKDNGLNEGDLMRSDDGHTWRDRLAALTAVFPSGAVSKSAQQAVMPPQGMKANPNGFAAIKAAARLHGGSNPALESLLSKASAAAPDDILSSPSK
jgi:hypothetical protein